VADPVTSAEADEGRALFPPRRVEVAAIERELEGLLGPAEAGDEAPITRAAMSNVVVYCEDDAQAGRVRDELSGILERHPSRVLVLVAAAEAVRAGIEASVWAQCSLAGGGRQICEEHVSVRAAPGAARRLPSAVRPLLIGDLPTGLWWAAPDPPSAGGAVFEELADLADQVIYDSVGWQEPQLLSALDWLAREREQRVADLAWPRVLPWRRALAETFDPALRPGALAGIERVEIEHGPHALPQAWLLLAWLAHALDWRPQQGAVEEGVALTWRLASAAGTVEVAVRRAGEGPSALRGVSVASRRAAPTRLRALPGGRLEVEQASEDARRWFALRERSRVSLLADQLSERASDPGFRAALETSRALAEVLDA
jgi:glucose-6-phosphate dehydrogenase assembly protein OpcA